MTATINSGQPSERPLVGSSPERLQWSRRRGSPLLECCDQRLQDAEGTIVEDCGGVNMQPAARNGNQAAGVAFALVQETLRSQDQRISERQVIGHINPVLALPFVQHK